MESLSKERSCVWVVYVVSIHMRLFKVRSNFIPGPVPFLDCTQQVEDPRFVLRFT